MLKAAFIKEVLCKSGGTKSVFIHKRLFSKTDIPYLAYSFLHTYNVQLYYDFDRFEKL